MEVNKTPVLTVFDVKQRLEVPLFQRQYVWNEEQQWTPLWEDIQRKFIEVLDGNKEAPNHFLGAMVLDQKQTPTGHVIVRQVIDGQQRLTTLQIFLAAYRDFCRAQGCEALASECDKFVFNTGMMANPDVDKFKIWPTQLDRPQFKGVVTAGSRIELEKRHPLVRKPYHRKYEPRPRMVEAYLFFYDRLSDFFLGSDGEKPQAADFPIETRVDECFQALRGALMVVVIDLQKDDDPQVIFETLNARGEPLLPADLLRNYIFFRATRANMNTEAVYEKYWSRFDDPFWREEVSQGRLFRPRSDLFMQHFLTSRQGRDVPIKHLYVEYRHWLESSKPFPDIKSELATLAAQREDFRRIIAPDKNDVLFGISSFLQTFDVGTTHPLLLAILDANPGDVELSEIARVLESYLLRRAVCMLPTKNYNRIFLSIIKNMRDVGQFTASKLKSLLLALTGDSGLWPDDVQFQEAWLKNDAYAMKNPRLSHIFLKINETYASSKTEKITIDQPLSIEHLMPQTWIPNWPLEDGSKGMSSLDAMLAPKDEPRAGASIARHAAVQTMGNLTIITFELNASQSNSDWKSKRQQLGLHSLLPINQSVISAELWDEAAILDRGQELFKRASQIWPR